MRYEIIENPEYTNRVKVGIKLHPENATLMFFLSGLKIEAFPVYISELLLNKGFGIENTWVTFYEEMDWEDKADLESLGGIKEGEVNIYFYNGKSSDFIMPKSLFKKIFFDYTQKLLEVYSKDHSLPENWAENLKLSLETLKDSLE